MTSERTQAYGRIVKTLEDLGPAKLLAAEQERIRERRRHPDLRQRARRPRASPRWTTSARSPTTSSSPAAGPRSAPCCSSTTSPATGPLAPVA